MDVTPFTNYCMSLTDWSRTGYFNFNSSLKKLKELNVNYIAVNLWVYQDRRTSSSIYRDRRKTPSDNAVRSIIDSAGKYGMKVFLKVNVDSRDNIWRGKFMPDNVGKWFKSYRKMLLPYAALAGEKNIEMFSVGCELKSLSGNEHYDTWKDIIKELRKAYPGKLIYCANWDEYENVSFWDELDYIGVDAYFPLHGGDRISALDIRMAWTNCEMTGYYEVNWIKKLNDFRKRIKKDIFFAEAGFSSAEGSAAEPWRWDLTPVNLQLQADCYKGTFLAFQDLSWMRGIFWWDWQKDLSAGGEEDTELTPMNKPAQKVLKEFYIKRAIR
ncbi:MAG: hypothetical protein KKH98_15305 [Spirochaetes bacterium]|nr:hypothetical protein [Spirochaetota bacterium]